MKKKMLIAGVFAVLMGVAAAVCQKRKKYVQVRKMTGGVHNETV